MPTEHLISESDEGILVLRGNETILRDKTSGDPVATRWRSANETIGKHCIDVEVVNPVTGERIWRELGYWSGKRDERGRTDPAHAEAVEWEFWSHIPGRGWDDKDYERVFGIRHDGPVFYKGSSTGSHEFRHPNGVIWGVMQGDGNLVLYKNRVPFDYATGDSYWSSGTVVNPGG